MPRWLSITLVVVVLLIVAIGGAYWWYLGDGNPPANLPAYSFDIAAVRAKADELPGGKATDIRVETVATGNPPATFAVAGDGFNGAPIGAFSYQVILPADIQGAPGLGSFDAADPLVEVMNRKLMLMRRKHAQTREYMEMNALRGIDSFVFALLFVAAVGLGPFAGVLGIALHTWGSAAKFFADHIENVNLGPLEAVRTTGAGRFTAIAYALVPDVLPVMLSTTLFWWEFNVRASTVLGVVGAGGIGQELKNSMDLLDFPRLFTIIAVILVVVTALDQLSGWLRKRLV